MTFVRKAPSETEWAVANERAPEIRRRSRAGEASLRIARRMRLPVRAVEAVLPAATTSGETSVSVVYGPVPEGPYVPEFATLPPVPADFFRRVVRRYEDANLLLDPTNQWQDPWQFLGGVLAHYDTLFGEVADLKQQLETAVWELAQARSENAELTNQTEQWISAFRSKEQQSAGLREEFQRAVVNQVEAREGSWRRMVQDQRSQRAIVQAALGRAVVTLTTEREKRAELERLFLFACDQLDQFKELCTLQGRYRHLQDRRIQELTQQLGAKAI